MYLAPLVNCDEETRRELERIANSQSEAHSMVRRTKIVLYCIEGLQIKLIAKELGEETNTVRKWRDRLLEKGIERLKDALRLGKPVRYDEGSVYFKVIPLRCKCLNR